MVAGQRKRLSAPGMRSTTLHLMVAAPAQPPLRHIHARRAARTPHGPPAKRPRPGRRRAAFQRCRAAQTRWAAWDGQRPAPGSTVGEIIINGKAEPEPMMMGV
ncbi:hypothetical protein GCM10010331_16190 [Streptomyces xanthochromogenes]|nr:hypothetical protein GCM10010331_16190 [Streptomyces xanthochromogenes]